MFLSRSNIEWQLLDEKTQFELEAEWRSAYAHAFRRRGRVRTRAKAEFEFLLQSCDHYFIVPFTSKVQGLAMAMDLKRSIVAYECRGNLVPFGAFCEAEFFVSPWDFAWTMIHTHEDFAFGGPFFIRREWLS